MNDVVIVSAVRTALGRLGGTLKDVQPEELARVVITAALERSGLDPAAVDEVIFGQTKQSADAANLARVAALRAGFPVEVPAYTVMRQCGSGLQAVANAVQAIRCGEAEIVVAGGVESMSLAPYYLRGARFGFVSGNSVVVDPNTESQPRSQPYEVYGDLTMGLTAENLAEQYEISREEQDAFALRSQERAWAAIESGRFRDEIVPVEAPQKKGPPAVFAADEYPRHTSLEQLAALPAVFREGGSVTAGNSSGRNDGAACLVVMAEAAARERGVTPLATVRAHAVAGVDPRIMGIGPVPATRKALDRAGLRLSDLGLVEVNEAFAAQTIAVIRDLGLDEDILNVNGGAIALGHPLGCSGARILTTLLHEMHRRGTRYGLASICIAGGQGMSTIIETEG
ncbi:MAG TPA: acetyl-CoA C-acetyltransferase [Thermoleophilia bacterium]|nr:acetyl-CoA C-acetyltransferase [Thermoleophilia bacterium]